MASLRIFVSSTCYDLSMARSQLRSFIVGMGHEPVMSDYSDVLYDHRAHTQTSCLQELSNCDLVILIVGSRFGGKAVPGALESIDFDELKTASLSTYLIDNKENLSITQLEICKAIDSGLPVFTFVEEGVLHDHRVYETNKDKAIIDDIGFPSIEDHQTAKYIFEFINFIRYRRVNNSLTSFSKIEDIETFLRKQWSALFQRMLLEQRNALSEKRRIVDLSEQLEDLKTAVLTSITRPDLRETARGAIRYRRILSFIQCLKIEQMRDVLLSDTGWSELLTKAGIIEMREITAEENRPSDLVFVLGDGTFYRSRYNRTYIQNVERDWEAFRVMNAESRLAIIDAIIEDRSGTPFPVLRHVDKPFAEVYPDVDSKDDPPSPPPPRSGIHIQ